MVANEFIYIAEEAGNPNANDYKEILRMKQNEFIKELKQVKPVNVGQLVCRVGLGILLTKLP